MQGGLFYLHDAWAEDLPASLKEMEYPEIPRICFHSKDDHRNADRPLMGEAGDFENNYLPFSSFDILAAL